jgi:mannose-1-phosphate guanylyltransferase
MILATGPNNNHTYAVILAGGRGTRFWPRSRRSLPKQLLPVVGEKSLLAQTIERLSPLIPPERMWVLTSELLRPQTLRQTPQIPRHQIIAEPVQRNTGPAIALAAHLLRQHDPDAVMGVFPADHVISKPAQFLRVLERAFQAAARRDELIVLGIRPRWAETGYGYIEFPRGEKLAAGKLLRVVRFHEKPIARKANRLFKAGHFFWNSGTFFWRAAVIGSAVERFLPKTAAAISRIAPATSTSFRRTLAEHYPLCDDHPTELLSIDYAVLERAANIAGFVCPDFGWNDVGSWQAVYELLPKDRFGNVRRSPVILGDESGNYIDAPGKYVALIGVHDLVVVDTPDALLICPRKDAQKVSALVKALEKEGLEDLL